MIFKVKKKDQILTMIIQKNSPFHQLLRHQRSRRSLWKIKRLVKISKNTQLKLMQDLPFVDTKYWIYIFPKFLPWKNKN